MKKPRCRHGGSWVMTAGGFSALEWCYECGAMRLLHDGGVDGLAPVTAWCGPVGLGGNNPFDTWQKRTAAFRKRRSA